MVILLGIGMFFYPNISNWYMQKHQGNVIQEYEKKTDTMSEQEIEEMKQAVREYNAGLVNNRTVLTDPFDEEAWKTISTNYKGLLNVDGVMAYVEIPEIDVYLPVYHGTSKETLEKGIGHLENTSLPMGGKGTHCVLSGHSGLPTALFFTNLDQLKKEDYFYIHVLDETLAYKVDQISVVEPEDISLLSIDPDEDYVTLVTCTPFGKNTHRLLVRGKRTAYDKDKLEKDRKDAGKRSLWDKLRSLFGHRSLALQIIGAALGVLLAILIFLLVKRKKQTVHSDKKMRQQTDSGNRGAGQTKKKNRRKKKVYRKARRVQRRREQRRKR